MRGVETLATPSTAWVPPRVVAAGRVAGSVWLIAILPALDAVLNQAQAAYEIRGEDWSLLQGVRGLLLLILLCAVAASLRRLPEVERPIRTASLAMGGLLSLGITVELLSEGELWRPSIVAYGQIAYWLSLWLLAAATARGERERSLILTGILIGVAVLAGSVLYAYGTGARLTEKYRGITASFGWFHSGKLIGGPLVIGGLLSFYLALRRRGALVYAVLGTAAWIAALLTHNRSGQVSLALLLVWLAGWHLLWARRDRQRRLLATAVLSLQVLAVALAARALLSELELRWRDLADPAKAGSGRLVLWRIAWDRFQGGDLYEQLCGTGYRGMLAAVDAEFGRQLHTHSDLFDLLLVGGLAGVAVFVVFHAELVTLGAGSPRASPEFGVSVGVCLVMLSQSLLTGQFLSPSSMPYYLLALVGLGAGTPRAASSPVPD